MGAAEDGTGPENRWPDKPPNPSQKIRETGLALLALAGKSVKDGLVISNDCMTGCRC